MQSPLMLAVDVWGQQFEWSHLGLIGLLVVMEGVLSIDNALVLGLLAKRLPKKLQGRALTYGLVGAFVFRIVSIAAASYLLQWRVVKLLGGGYLVYVAVKHFFFEVREQEEDVVVADPQGTMTLVRAESGEPISAAEEAIELKERVPIPLPHEMTEPPELTTAESRSEMSRFWMTVLVIELTDIAFAVDSILAAIAMVGSKPSDLPAEAPHPQLWVVITGGVLGVILMRFAAIIFIKLLERFPRFEVAAYLLVIIIGAKLLADWYFNAKEHVLDFHDSSHPAFWVFWISMAVCFCVGFIGGRTPLAANR